MKTRLTITLPEELLKTIDKLVDKKTIRNRSHAIEHLVRESLDEKITTALILAGGKHTGTHNPLLKKISGTPLIELQLRQLKSYGITHVIICLGQKDSSIATSIGNGAHFGLDITYSYEEKKLGTAGAIKQAMTHSTAETILVLHGDVLTTIALDELIEFHKNEGADATIAVKPKLGKKELGQVYLQGSRVTNFSKTGIESEISIINTGVYILSRGAIEAIPDTTPAYLESDVFPKLAQANKLRAFIFQGIWYDISTQDQVTEAEQNWKV